MREDSGGVGTPPGEPERRSANSMTCANRACQAETLYFRKGSLHWIDREDSRQRNPCLRETRPVWLCEECSKNFVIQLWRAPGFQIQPRRRVGPSPHAQASARVLPAPAVRTMPPVPVAAAPHTALRTMDAAGMRLPQQASATAA
jgi:hypothetical protein